MRRTAVVLVVFLVGLVGITALSPLRHITADAVPGRYGAFVLRCGGGFDLRHVAFLTTSDRDGRLPYWAVRDRDGAMVSTFGPAPAIAGALAMPGDAATDHDLRVRERLAAAFLIALAAGLLALGSLAHRTLRTSILVGALAAASYAGLATLGQALWQQTVALPFLVGALATLAWRDRRAGWLVGTPALLVVAVLIRPGLAPLALGLAVIWLVARPRRWWLGVALAVVAAIPFVVWNVHHLGTPLPLGQATANAALTDETFVFSRAQLGLGLGGLLVSPARGLLWFAPVVLFGAIRAWRAKHERVLVMAMAGQLLMMALFYRWWGGTAYGPRLLAETTWVGIWLALGSGVAIDFRGAWRGLGIAAIAMTIVAGQLGLWRWRAEQWETRRMPDIDDSALWDFTDSPIPSTFRSIDDQPMAIDIEAPTTIHCD